MSYGSDLIFDVKVGLCLVLEFHAFIYMYTVLMEESLDFYKYHGVFIYVHSSFE